MIAFVYGGSGSGKSEYAEQMILRCSKADSRYYIATMKAYGEEGRQRVLRHRTLRSGKHFHTIECPVNLPLALGSIPDPSGASILLECVSNLTANEMFDRDADADSQVPDSIQTDSEIADHLFAEHLVQDISLLCSRVRNAVIVSNNIFDDGADYDILTVRYMKRLGEINRAIAAMADSVTEVVAGIPVKIR